MLAAILVGVLEKSRKATVLCSFSKLELGPFCSFMINKGFQEILTLLLELNL